MLCLLLVIILLVLLLFTTNKNSPEPFNNCGFSAPNIPPPSWYQPEQYNPDYWKTPINSCYNNNLYKYWNI